MNATKFEATLRGVSAVAQKVFKAVPIEDLWTPSQVRNEMTRQGHHLDLHAVRGCLGVLHEAGLIREVGGTFIRVKVRTKQPKETVVPTNTPLSIVKEETAVDRLLGVVGRVGKLVDEFKALSAELEDIAIGVTEQVAASDEDMKKLRQLQQILKSIT